MEQKNNKGKQYVYSENEVYTKLKFIKSERNGALISFVSQNPVNDVICGVRQDSPYPKKIVIIDKNLSSSIIINVLYDCILLPMTATKNVNTGEDHIPGYIAVSATPVQFKATVTTKYIKGSKYQVDVSFGNKTIRFDPFKGQKESVKSLPACLAVLEKRCDVKDIMEVVSNFTCAANELYEQMKQDMREIHNSHSKNEKTSRRNRH